MGSNPSLPEAVLHRVSPANVLLPNNSMEGIPETETNRAKLIVYVSAVGIALVTALILVVTVFRVE